MPVNEEALAAVNVAVDNATSAERANSRARFLIMLEAALPHLLPEQQPASTWALSRASTRSTRSSRTVNLTLHWLGQSVQIEPASSMSQGRARKRYV